VLTETLGEPQLRAASWLAPLASRPGCSLEYHTLDDLQPHTSLQGSCAGIIVVLASARAGHVYEAWLLTQIRAGVRVVILGKLGFLLDGVVARELGLQASRLIRRHQLQLGTTTQAATVERTRWGGIAVLAAQSAAVANAHTTPTIDSAEFLASALALNGPDAASDRL
jgi:hypothetical protein